MENLGTVYNCKFVLKICIKFKLIISSLNKHETSALATSPDGKYLSLGLDSGRIQLLSTTDFSKIDDTVELHIKYITVMKFSPKSDYFVSAANSGTCVISQLPTLGIYRRLAGHCERISDLDFSSDSSQLVTASFDGTAQIWNVQDGTPIANFRKHIGAVLSVFWMANGEIHTGGDDYILHCWTGADCSDTNPPQKSIKQDKGNRKKRNPKKVNQKKPSIQSDHIDFRPKNQILPAENMMAEITLDDESSKPHVESKINKRKKFSTLSQIDHNSPLDDLLLLQHLQKTNGTGEAAMNLSFYLKNSDQSLPKVISDEMKHSVTGGSYTNAVELATWLGTFGYLIEQGNINDYVVGLAASGGQSVWRHVVECYIKQLDYEQNFAKASTYLLALNRVEHAVEMLLKGRFYRDALSLAKLRLDSSNPLIEKILNQWADRAALGGNLVQSAKCKIAINDIPAAIRFLQRRNNLSYSLVGLELLYESDSSDAVLIDQLLAAVLNPAVGFGRWDEVFELVKNKNTTITNQMQLFLYFHQVCHTHAVLVMPISEYTYESLTRNFANCTNPTIVQSILVRRNVKLSQKE